MQTAQIFLYKSLKVISKWFIIAYQDILNILYCDPRNCITNYRRIYSLISKNISNLYIEDPHWVYVTYIAHIHKNIQVCYRPTNPQAFGYWFHNTILDSHYVSVCFLENSPSNSQKTSLRSPVFYHRQ